MFFNWRLFIRALRLLLWEQPFTFRRWGYGLFFSGLFLFFLGIVMVARLLDWILFPRFRRQPVRAPVFIIAPPRSGTSLTQRLLSLDEDRFVHLKMYQTIFPAVCLQKLFDGVARVDRHLGGPGRRVLEWCEQRWFGGWDHLHRMRLNQPEEDDALFLYAFSSEAIYMLFPFVRSLWEAGFPDALPAQSRRRLMAYYRSCLQRHLFANGPGKTLLSKATQSCGTVESLREAFPDAIFITIIRHPYRSVASHVSLFVPVWQTHSPEIAKDGPEAREYAQLAIEWYRHLFAFRERVSPKNYYCLDYRDLVEDPAEAIQLLYQHFGWEVTPEFRRRLQQANDGQREFRSKHEYSLEEFGLTRELVQAELGSIFDFYRLER